MAEFAEHEATGDLRKPIDKDLPNTTRCSLAQWCATWRSLKASGSLQQRDQFALTGHYTDPITGRPTRSRMDFHDHRIPDHVVPTQRSDIDSVIGIVKDHFPIAPGVMLKYFMLLSPIHTLDANLHLPPVLVQDEHGPDKLVELHKIPNGRFLEMEPQALVRICFPRLERRSNCLSDNELKQLYDYAVHPAALETLPQELTGTWPATWSNEMFRAQQLNETCEEGRRVQHTGRDVHSVYLNTFIRRMREYVNAKPDLQWARSFFFIVEMRGLKTRDGSIHIPPEQPAIDGDGELEEQSPRVQAVDRVLASFYTDEFEPDHWFIDLGMNFLVPAPLGGYACPLPAVEAHAAILAHVLEMDMDTCLGWVRGDGGYYHRDELAQLKALAGFRFTNPNPQLTGIHYIQLYTSDKSIIYNLNLPNHAQRITNWQMLRNWDKVRKNHFQPLMSAFKEASGAHEMYVRLEVRVEFSQYPFVQLRVPDAQARAWMFWADPTHYWGWKLYRLESIYSVIRMWMASRGKFVLDDLPEAGSLLVSLVWMANALVNRPDEGGTWNEIQHASSVHDMSEGALIPVWPLQAHFLHTLRFVRNEQPRLSSQRTVAVKTILYVCSSRSPPVTEAELHTLISEEGKVESDLQPDVLDVEPANVTYPPAAANKQRTVKVRNKEQQANKFADLLPEPESVRRYESEDEDYEARPRPTPRSQQLTDIVCNLPLQIFQKCPHQKSAGRSWCALDRSSPLIQFDIFSSLDKLEQAFPSHIMFGSESDRWDAVVDSLFPTISESKKATQGLHCLAAREDFINLQRRLEPGERAELVRRARQFVHEHWVWLPYGVPKSHLWATGLKNVPKHALHVGPLSGGPWIIMNPTHI